MPRTPSSGRNPVEARESSRVTDSWNPSGERSEMGVRCPTRGRIRTGSGIVAVGSMAQSTSRRTSATVRTLQSGPEKLGGSQSGMCTSTG